MPSKKMVLTLRAALAEFLACMFFVFFGAGSVCAHVSSKAQSPIDYASSFGFAITVLAFAIGDISGAHINPAVTLSLAITKNIELGRAGLYFVAQLLGGLAGGGLLRLSVGEEHYRSGIGMPTSINAGQAVLLEFMGTLCLVFVVFSVAVWSAKPDETDLSGSTISALAPIPIGLTVLVVHLTLGPFTGCGINPMRVLGAVVWEKDFFSSHAGKRFWVYWVGPFAASLVGPLLYWCLYGTVMPGTGADNDLQKHESTTDTKPPPKTVGTGEAWANA